MLLPLVQPYLSQTSGTRHVWKLRQATQHIRAGDGIVTDAGSVCSVKNPTKTDRLPVGRDTTGSGIRAPTPCCRAAMLGSVNALDLPSL